MEIMDGFVSPTASSAIKQQGVKDGLDEKLWRACAGATVYVPRTGEKVFYFPQGHLEQVAAIVQHQQDVHMDIPVYNLPSKILCRVMSVLLKAEANTDEVFAQITLIPESKQDELNHEDSNIGQIIPSRSAANFFSKTLTPSDTSTHGGFSIPKRHADECFPPLDMSLQPPTQELVAKDLHGFEWRFRHIYRGQPKRHLLTSGWNTFLNSKKLAAGDTCIFLSGENGDIRVGIRRAMKQHNNASTSTSLISGDSMQLGVLAGAYHAVATGSMFTVYYRPWSNPFEFIVPLQHYIKSTKMDYSIGTRVQMLLEVEESTRRHAGAIIGVEDIDGIKWPGSDWRCLKVQWDAILDSYLHPERVCPWWIERFDCAKQRHIPILPSPKRARVLNLPLPGLDIVQNSAKPESQRLERDLQGQDYYDVASPQPTLNLLSLTDAVPPPKAICDSKSGAENQLHLLPQDLQLNPLHHQSTCSSMSFPLEDLSTSSSNANNCAGSESQGWPSPESKDENDVRSGQPRGRSSTYKLFGVSLTASQLELPSQQFPSALSVPPMSHQSSVYATIRATKPYGSISGLTLGKTCKKCRSVNRSCIKVLKHGTALGRAIDLSRYAGYDKLLCELDSMFNFGGGLVNGSSGWHVTCIDDDGDLMLLGDFPWQDFQSMVQKMIICPINNPSPSSSGCPKSI